VQSAKPPFKSQDLIFFIQTLKQTNKQINKQKEKRKKKANCIIQEVNPAFCNAVCTSFTNEELKSKV
jgi:hypothetical protein